MALVLLALTGCDRALGGPLPPGASAPASSSAPAPADADASASPEPAEALPGPRVVPGPPALPAGTTTGLVPRLAAMRTDGFAAAARWAVPPGSSALGDTLTGRVADALRAFAEEHGTTWSPGVDLVAGGVATPCGGGSLFAPSPVRLTVGCTVVVASGPVVGERLVVAAVGPGGAADVRREVWYADASGGVHDGTALYADGAPRRVLALVSEGLRAAGRIDPTEDPFAGLDHESSRALLADSVVTGAGAGVVVTLAVPGAPGARPVSVHVPARLLEPVLSDVGRAVLAAASSGEPYAPPDVGAAGDPVDCSLLPCASITFDDGPTSLTPTLLDTLDGTRAAATFFLQGASVQRNPGVAARAVAAGHEVANHTWGHPDLTKLKDDEVVDEVVRTQDAIESATGVRPTSIRPPYGASNRHVRDLIRLPFVVWDVDTRDWQDPGVDAVVERAVGQAVPGSIILMHDTHSDTIEAVPSVIAGLRGRGFALATVSGQFRGALPGAGALVSHGPG
ncbi:polysaccharide deacetylase family protein [Agromyces tropicus]|uniref:polysaccharide deacetylase family protein n=1 Tax=Agromyces tropicus TaxID=555371 RepID=UPI0031D77106